MESKAKFLGHPIHPILVTIPVGLLATSVVFDIVYLGTQDRTFAAVAFWMIVAGIAGGVLAALAGLVDLSRLPSTTRASRLGMWHAVGNAVVLGLFSASAILRYQAPDYLAGTLPLALAWLAFVLIGVTGWLGAEMVHRLGVSIDQGAHLEAPSSLSGQPAHLAPAAEPAPDPTISPLRERAVGERNVQ
jgi:uncharacterized membrane protein